MKNFLLLSAAFCLIAIGCAAWAVIPMIAELQRTMLAANLAIQQAREQIPVVAASIDAKADRALSEVTALRSDLRAVADKLDEPLAKFGAAVAQVGETTAAIKPMLASAANVAKQVDEAAPLFLDCDHNPDCAFNRFQGMSKGIEQSAFSFGAMSRDIQRATPAAITSFQGIQGSVQRSAAAFELGFPSIVQNTSGITANIAQITKPRWWETPLKAAVAGAVVAGSLSK